MGMAPRRRLNVPPMPGGIGLIAQNFSPSIALVVFFVGVREFARHTRRFKKPVGKERAAEVRLRQHET